MSDEDAVTVVLPDVLPVLALDAARVLLLILVEQSTIPVLDRFDGGSEE